MIVVLAGRRIDSPDTEEKRFPLENRNRVEADLREFLKEAKPQTIVCSGACGADLLALRLAGKLQIRRVMVLPFAAADFKKISVTDRPGDWGTIFDEVFNEIRQNENEEVIVLDCDTKDPDAFEKANLQILDKAESMSRMADRHSEKQKDITALVVWNGQSREDSDATAHFLKEAQHRDFGVIEILTL